MTERSRPWSGTVTGDAGPYTDDQWTDVWATLLGPTVATEGVFIGQLDDFLLSSIVASPISVERGRALVDGTWYESDADESIVIPTPAGNPRIDRLVLRKDWALQTIRLTRIAGAEAASPTPPALVQIDGTTWDLPLHQVRVTTGGVINHERDDRVFLGQYEPAGYTKDDQYFIDEDFVEALSYSSGNVRRIWVATFGGGGGIDVLQEAGFGTGGIAFDYPAAAAVSVLLETGLCHRPDQINAQMAYRMKSPNTDANLDVWVGFGDSLSVTPTNGVGFRRVGAGNWFAVCRAGGVETAVDTAQAADNTWRTFETRHHGSDEVEFLIDGALITTIQANIPSDVVMNLKFLLIDTAAPAAQNYLHADYVTGRALNVVRA